jgi:hypothetical protein
MSAIGVAERFWAKVRKGEGCWEWTASRRGGYGQMQAGATGRTPGAHRISWELHFGEIPAGMCVCHRCDNRLCVRPDHLFLGTRDDNQKDMARKGRAASGPRCSASKLSGLQVECARTLAGRGVSQRAIAEALGVTQTNIGQIVRGVTWRSHVDLVDGLPIAQRSR